MAKLIFQDNNEEVELEDGSEIQPTCEEAGIPFACTEGICGTCIIEVTEGMENLSAFTPEEEDFLGDMDQERMACQCRILQGKVKVKF